MGKDTFENWFHKEFIAEDQYFVKKKVLLQKVKLHMDIAPSHPNLSTLALS